MLGTSVGAINNDILSIVITHTHTRVYVHTQIKRIDPNTTSRTRRRIIPLCYDKVLEKYNDTHVGKVTKTVVS